MKSPDYSSIQRSFSPPPLRKTEGPKPTILLVDDDSVFLNLNEEYWREFFSDHAEVLTLNPEEGKDPVAWIRKRFEKNEPLNAVFIDENIPGRNALDILDDLRAVEAARYLPVIVMTAYLDRASDTKALEKGALRYMCKHQDNFTTASLFLYEALFSLPQFRDQVEDNMWTDLIRDIAIKLSNKEPIKKVLESASQFLIEHFGDSTIYIRQHEGELLRLLGGRDLFAAGEELPIKDGPLFLRDLLKHDGPSELRVAALADDHFGTERWNKMKGWHLVAVPLNIGENRIGTVTLYRRPDRLPFRPKDAVFLRHFALEISSHLGVEREMQQLRDRQTQLAQFVQDISNAGDESEAVNLVVDFVHKEIQLCNDTCAKTTLRLIETGKATIPRLCHRGLKPNNEDSVVDIYQEDSVYARVIKNRQSERYGNVPEETKEKGFHYTHTDVKSALTVPLTSAGLCLGALNMEHLNQNQYRSEDEGFSQAVVGLAANSLVRLRAQRFIKGLLELGNDLVDPDLTTPVSLLPKAFDLLSDFTGYAYLLCLIPDESRDASWQLLHVLASGAKELDEQETEKWHRHIESKWAESFIFKTLCSDVPNYTNDSSDIASDAEVGVETAAMEVVHLRGEPEHKLTGILALLFLLPDAINPFQRDLLDMFGQFLGSLTQVEGNIRRILDESILERQEAVLGRALSMFRHRLRNELGVIANSLNNARAEGLNNEWLDRARRVLARISNEINNTRNFVKVPEYSEFGIDEIWDTVLSTCRVLAREKNIRLDKWQHSEKLSWISDPDIVTMILESLVQNAIEQCSSGDYIRLRVNAEKDKLFLTVCDSGPGVASTIRPKLFQPGVTSKPAGTGFGLHFNRRRAHDLQGDLVLEEDYREGAAFSLILPKLSGD